MWDITGAAIPTREMSVDRKKSTGDYTSDNCRWMHKGLNIFRKRCVDDRLLNM